jgi:hypothetical protein
MFREARSKAQLLDIVGASNPNPSHPGPVVVAVRLWDGRLVRASYYGNGPKYMTPDAETRSGIFFDIAPLVPLVERLLESGESFVTVTGTHDDVYCLEWSMAN